MKCLRKFLNGRRAKGEKEWRQQIENSCNHGKYDSNYINTTLYVNGLRVPIKRQKFSEYICLKKQIHLYVVIRNTL